MPTRRSVVLARICKSFIDEVRPICSTVLDLQLIVGRGRATTMSRL